MHATTLQAILEHLRKLTNQARDRDLSDADLLERFHLRREEAAFTLLLQRHGPMVLAICRRILGDVHAAEDAFQATFLVLVRNAGTIRKQQSLAAWLHGVASRIAHKARMRWVRQQVRQREILPPLIMDDPSKILAVAELRAALDEEIERLPAKYRTPLVLCYLTDKTHEQAAHELGWPKSSVTSRLARARELLQRRLRLRGFTVPAGVLAALLSEQSASAAIPSLLTLSTVRLAVQALTGETLAVKSVAVLAGTFAGRAVVSKWTAALLLLATIGMASTIGYRMAGSDSPSKQPEAAPRPQAEGEPKTARGEPRRPRSDRLGDALPDEVLARIGSGRMRHGGYVRALSFTPDGKSIVSGGIGSLCVWDAATGNRQWRFTVNTDWNLAVALTAAGITVASADKAGIVTVYMFDPESGKCHRRVEMKERATSATLSFSPDGKQLAFTQGNT
ncbi:MAG: sigma-70 family RNA polymerase sigma factor, partial [Gemmataceae bacterium]